MPVGRAILELPAGMMDDDGGDFVGTAAREVGLVTGERTAGYWEAKEGGLVEGEGGMNAEQQHYPISAGREWRTLPSHCWRWGLGPVLRT